MAKVKKRAVKKKAAPKKKSVRKRAAPKKRAVKKAAKKKSGVKPGRNANSPKYRNKQVKKREPKSFNIAGYSVEVIPGAPSILVGGNIISRTMITAIADLLNNK